MYTVIVADDEEEIRRGIIKKVKWEELGFQVIGEAANGADALELVEKLEPDLLLTDIRMPFLSGIELARSVREVCPTVQIAFLSGFDDLISPTPSRPSSTTSSAICSSPSPPWSWKKSFGISNPSSTGNSRSSIPRN